MVGGPSTVLALSVVPEFRDRLLSMHTLAMLFIALRHWHLIPNVEARGERPSQNGGFAFEPRTPRWLRGQARARG